MLRFGLCVTFMALCFTLASVPAAFSQWQQVALDGYIVRDVIFRPGDKDTAYAAVAQSNGGVYISTDMGLTWVLAGAVPPGRRLDIEPVNKDFVYLTCDDAIFRSSDGGTSWVEIDSGFDFNSDYGPWDIAVNPLHPETVYVTTVNFVGGGGLYRSSNQGDSWEFVDMPWLDGKGAIAIDPENSGRMYVAVRWDGPLARSLDGGSTWEGILPEVADDIAINPQNPDVVFVAANGRIYRSTDGGDTWTAFGTGAGLTGGVECVAINPVNPAIIYAGGYGGMFRSTDAGDTWTVFDDGLPTGVEVQSIAVEGESGEMILVGTAGHGIYRRTTSLAGVGKVSSGAVSLEVLPNPVSATSSISFTLPVESLTTLKIYDIRGRLVEKLLSEEVSAGYHSATWDTRDQSGTLVSPGIYYLELQTPTDRIIKPVVVVR